MEIEHAIAKWFDTRQHIIVPNISYGWDFKREFDIFAIKKTGYAVEVEIKRTKSDLKKDLLKEHQHKTNKIKELYFAIPDECIDEWKEFIPERAGILGYYRTSFVYKYQTENSVHVSCRKYPKANKEAKKLTIEEQLKIARLGCMRIWNLKKMLINYQNSNYT